ncbi:hypothetical protein [Gordonia sp. KTR9]|uniref:hypothetical protein n=1 Tax=Gordonia sp. KTR9 TaxID=337191 RepID=UPI0011D2B595|nr:hypothetical protein [Gordonia sp. KTR9]
MTSEIAAGRVAHLLRVPLQDLVAAVRTGEIAGRVAGSTATVHEGVSKLIVWAAAHRETRSARTATE